MAPNYGGSRASREGAVGNRAAFTLVELLVVVAIVSVLAALLLPTVNKALQSARNTNCMSNLRQVGFAAGMYTDDSGGWMLPAYFLPRLAPYSIGYAILHCPLESKRTVDVDTLNYGVEYDFITGLPPGWWNTPKYRRREIEATRKAPMTVYFMDAKGWGFQHIPPYVYRGWKSGARHNGVVNVLWVDLHLSHTSEDRLADSNWDGTDDAGYFKWADAYVLPENLAIQH